ncbi:glycosyltransferase, partial [Brachyspira catarrhinii]
NKLLLLKEIKDFKISFYKSPNIEKYKKLFNILKKENPNVKHTYSIFIKLDILFLFDNIDKILFLDVDQIVLTRINKLFSLDLKDNYLAVFQHPKYCCQRYLKYKDLSNFLINDCGFSAVEENYLAGDCVMYNLKLIRENKDYSEINKAIEQCFYNYNKAIFTEEHILLFIFRTKIMRVDFNLNETKNPPEDYQDWDTRQLKFLHFTGKRINSYLQADYNGCFDSAYQTFWNYFQLTPFFKENFIEYMNVFTSHTRKIFIELNQIKNEIENIKYSLQKIIDNIAWWIPIKSLRNTFRNKFFDKFIGGG